MSLRLFWFAAALFAAVVASAAANNSTTSQNSRTDAPAPPQASGIISAESPMLFTASHNSGPNDSSASLRFARDAACLASLDTDSRIAASVAA